MGGVLAILEQREGMLKRVSYEALTAGRRLAEAKGGRLHALAIGPATLDPSQASRFGATTIFAARDDRLRHYQPDVYAALAEDLVRRNGYDAIVLGATALGKDLGPRLAARLSCPLTADVTALAMEDGAIVVSRPVYSGKAILKLRVRAVPCVISLRPNNFYPEESPGDGKLQELAVPDVQLRTRTVQFKEPETAKLDVAEAPIVVSGGRGLKDPANFKLLEDLAAALGNAAVGASRAVVDAGWRPHSDQVGQTGKTVSPALYFAIGISGAIQHLAGMRTAGVIVAINKDKDAPIFKVADYGIVGDLFEIVPRLTEEIKKLKASE
ncbi:Acryloyl-CoA reductase electron transfer subunit beta [bacterium HR33]|nr:Acryloyl-CoA reductase electron transfer subunit beta [bacterium HR33]